MNVKKKLFLISLFLVSPLALANGPCPDGTFNPNAGVCMCSNGSSVGPNQSCGGGGNYLIPRWGAIAVNFGGAEFSFISSSKSQNDANKRAMKACSDRGNNCQIAASFKNACAALAWDSKAIGVGIDASQKRAERKAMQQCGEKGGKQCKVAVTDACAGSPEND